MYVRFQSRSPPAGGLPAVAPVRLAHSFKSSLQKFVKTLFVYVGYLVSQTNFDVIPNINVVSSIFFFNATYVRCNRADTWFQRKVRQLAAHRQNTVRK
jgi:hypothetical protein